VLYLIFNTIIDLTALTLLDENLTELDDDGITVVCRTALYRLNELMIFTTKLNQH